MRFYSTRAWRTARLVRLALDGHRCTAEHADGARCDETRRLHVDHLEPVARLIAAGRDPCDTDVLQTLCASHHAELEWLRRRQDRRLVGTLELAA